MAPPAPSGAPGAAHGPTAIGNSTTLAARPGGSMTINHTLPDGSKLVVQHTGGPAMRPTVFKETTNPLTGAHSQTFADGHRITTTHDAVIYSAPHAVSLVRHADGLREAGLPNGRPVFREHFFLHRDEFGRENRFIERTVFTAIVAGTAIALGVPLVQHYAVVDYNGVVIYPYAPAIIEPGVIYGFRRPFLAPVVIGPTCLFCPPPVLAFAQPVVAYTDPVEMMADMQMATGFYDGMMPLNDAALPPPPPDFVPPDYYAPPSAAELTELQRQVAELNQQVAQEAQNNAALRDQLGAEQAQTAMLQSQINAPPPPPPTRQMIAISDDVRQQVRVQVKDELALHEKNQSSALPAIIASPGAANYVFQLGSAIDATNMKTGTACPLTTGDLLRFDQVPDGSEPVAQMRVVAAKSESCGSGTVVQISATDLQDMLNGFSQRLEVNVAKVKDQLASR